MKRCFRCGDRDETVQYRERNPKGLAILCAACHVDVRTSSVRQVRVPEREQHDRYAQMAVRYGVK
jgi:hypothetical protein